MFLAAPYSQFMNFETWQFDEKWQERLESLRSTLIASGLEVFSAHHNEEWGARWLPADICTPADFLAMKATDIVVAIIVQPASGGVLMELGWATALGKPCVLVFYPVKESLDPQRQSTPLIAGMGELVKVLSIQSSHAWTAEFLQEVLEAVEECLLHTGKMTLSRIAHKNAVFCSEPCSHNVPGDRTVSK